MAVVALDEITSLGSSVCVTDQARDVLLDSFGLENWLRRHIVGSLSGANTVAWPEQSDGVPARALEDKPHIPPVPDDDSAHHRLSELLTMGVASTPAPVDGHRVVDVLGRSAGHEGTGVGEITVERLSVGPRVLGSRMGYGTDDLSGPAPVRRLVNALHRDLSVHGWESVEDVSWQDRTITLRPTPPRG